VSEPRIGEFTDEQIRKLPACPKCGLEALGKTRMPGMVEEIVNPTKPLP
jgi:hypothetical protein